MVHGSNDNPVSGTSNSIDLELHRIVGLRSLVTDGFRVAMLRLHGSVEDGNLFDALLVLVKHQIWANLGVHYVPAYPRTSFCEPL